MRLQETVSPVATEMQLARLSRCAALAPWSRGLTVLSMWLMAGLIVLASLMAPVLWGLADQSIGAAVLLIGLATILGVLTVAVLLADAFTRPLVEMAGAVQELVRDQSGVSGGDTDDRHNNMVAVSMRPQCVRVVAAVQLVSDRKTRGAQSTEWTPAVRSRSELASPDGVGAHIDIVIPSDCRE